MKCFLKISAVLLLSGGAAFAYTNVLENGASQLVTNQWDISGQTLLVGDATAENSMQVNSGGSVTSQSGYVGRGSGALANSLRIYGSTAVWTNTGSIYVGDAGSSNRMEIVNDGRVVGADLFIGNSTNALGNLLTVEGTNSMLSLSGGLTVGHAEAAGNSFQLGSRGTAAIGGALTVHSNNYVILTDQTAVSVGGDINLYGNASILNATSGGEGVISLTGGGSSLNFVNASTDTIGDGVLFRSVAGTDRAAFSGGLFRVSPGLTNRFDNFQTLELTGSELTGHGTLGTASFGALQMNGGTISPSGDGSDIGTLTIEGAFTPIGTVTYQADIDGAQNDRLEVNDPAGLDLSALDLNVHVIAAPAAPTVSILSATNGLSGSFNSVQITDDLVLYNAGMTVNPANGTVDITTTADNTRFNSGMAFAGTEGVRAGHNGMKNAVFTRTKQLRRNLVATAHAIPQEAFLLSSTNGPAGAEGPGDQNTVFDMHVWMQYFNGRGSFNSSTGFDLNHQGSSIGVDRLIGEALTLGLNYTYARSAARTASTDQLDTETYWFGAYGEWVNNDGLYVDALAAYGLSSYNSVRMAPGYTAKGYYDGTDLSASLDVGQYYRAGNLALSPYAGLNFLTTAADAHSETDASGKRVGVDETDRTWFESALGLKGRYRFDSPAGRIQLTGFAEWSHDFVEDEVGTTMQADGLAPVRMMSISPDADTFIAGAGLSAITTDYMEIGIGYNGRFSENYEEHMGSLMLDIMF